MKLVALHGFTGSPASFAPVVAALAPAACFAPALFGHGGDAPSGEGHGFDAEIERLAGAVEARGFRGAHLVGYSLGARVGLGLLIRHPELFARATLIGVHPGLVSNKERAERRAADARWAMLLEHEGIEAFVDAWEAQPLFATQRALPDEVRAAQRRQRLAHDPRALARALGALGLAEMPNYWPDLAELVRPLTLVTGALDPKFCALAGRIVEHAPAATLRTIPGAGHNPLLERPGAVIEAIRPP